MAGRIRSFKPEILDTDEAIAGLSDAAFKLYAAIVLAADDAGRVRINPEQLASAGWWARPPKDRPSGKDVTAMVEDMASRKDPILRLYSAGGAEYAEILGWGTKGGTRYQAISKPQGARHPAPPSSQRDLPFPEGSGNAPGKNGASVPNHDSRNVPGTLLEDSGNVPVPIRSDPIRSEPIQTPAPARAIPVLVAPRAEDIPVDDRGHVTREAIREGAARAIATLRGRTPL